MKRRLAFIDWMKCAGMFVIVYGHTTGMSPMSALPPIYSKQLGVALFLFVLGYGVAKGTTSSRELVFNRLFDIYLFGIPIALLVTGIGLIVDGHLRRSNYLPFIGGINVVVNYFPANPTTWYVGTYIHFVLIGALVVRRIRISLVWLAVAFAAEVCVRSLLMRSAGVYVAYMAAPSWITVFLAGIWCGQRTLERVPVPWPVSFAVLVAFCVGWLMISPQFGFVRDFPFMRTAEDAARATLLVSLSISTLYLVITALCFATATRLPASQIVEFISRNTLVIFLAHMPVVYALTALSAFNDLPNTVRGTLLILICMPGLGAISEVIHRYAPLRGWRRLAYASVNHRLPPPATPATV